MKIGEYYKPIEKCNWWISRLFWASALISIVIPYSDSIPFNQLQQVPSVFFIVAVVAYSALSHYRGFFLIPRAEQMRRKQLLSDAFDVPLIPEKTVKYYNNELAPSIARLGVCILENSFFAKNVCHEMAKTERVKIFLYFLVWIAAICFRSTDLGLLLVLTQVLFSGEIIAHWIKLETLRSRNEDIYSNLYSYFLNQISPSQHPGIAGIIDSFVSYESAKAAASISQSSKIFHRLNPRLSEEWSEIRKQLRIDQL